MNEITKKDLQLCKTITLANPETTTQLMKHVEKGIKISI